MSDADRLREADRCVNCRRQVRKISFALGETWMHVDPNDSFPTESRGTAWRHCKLRVATPPADAVLGADQ
jgi:hypothetical protein